MLSALNMASEQGGIEPLWVPLLAELKAEQDIRYAQYIQDLRALYEERGLTRKRPLEQWRDPQAVIFDPYRCHCEVCGRAFVRNSRWLADHVWLLCSDRCARININAAAREWYHTNKPVNKGRVRKLQAALEGKRCDNCHRLIKDAKRTTRKYCSDACNMAAFLKRQQDKASPKVGSN